MISVTQYTTGQRICTEEIGKCGVHEQVAKWIANVRFTADKHSLASSARSTKRWDGMLMTESELWEADAHILFIIEEVKKTEGNIRWTSSAKSKKLLRKECDTYGV